MSTGLFGECVRIMLNAGLFIVAMRGLKTQQHPMNYSWRAILKPAAFVL
jgi:hypothetical protein